MGVSGYIAGLRARIGHDLLLLPGATVVPVDGAGRILLVRQNDDDTWGTIGGSVDPDEAPAAAAAREALEETGLDIEITGLRAVLGGPGYRRTYPNGDQVAYVALVYEGRVRGGQLEVDGDEVSEAAWFDAADLGEVRMNEFTRLLLRDADVVSWTEKSFALGLSAEQAQA
ncbi:MAG TPA: NUDIX domain-containing protein [Acidimicrobiales bacterium]|nr:NUDIX domain-containing protein [Acidimicrobiales bacterium]